ncbi:unnamed protein product [Rotaria socialis]|uniref:Uncharacterized protein n=1 Tax=Rotaria socialis TaxID=392032 RepID=A0A819TYS6_9BILA|nr:unnamed protein product [Rotaria socialis]CAF3426444.1 unnamed protein product [Rotaria socialis]CAF3462097.1 unnamed protein product [Rotaria socialis]CAF3619990.1 unnamed protein product [Rotaria socialis]CAF3705364.1 unnamed protein product [Rotaria socialis]
MASGYACQRCSKLPPPPPMFTIGPPPNILSIEVRCSSHLLSPSLIENKKSTSSSSISIALGIIIAFLITFSTIVLIKKRLIKRRRQHQHKIKFDNAMKVTSSSVKFNRHHQYNNSDSHHQHLHHHHLHPNRTKFIPLLSDSCSSDQTSSTPPNEYRFINGVIEPLLTCDAPHEYEQIKCDDSLSESLHYYCLIYCRQCSNYHPTSSSSSSSSSLCPRSNLTRPYYLPLSTNPTCQHQCSCYHRTYYQRNDNRFFEHQPMLMTKADNNSEDSNNHMKFIEETSPI